MPALTVSGNEITDAVRLAGLSGDGIAAPDSSFGIYPSSTNLIPNGGFANNTVGWSAIGAAVLVRDTAVKKFGAAALSVTCVNGEGISSGGAGAQAVSAGPISVSCWFLGVAGAAYSWRLQGIQSFTTPVQVDFTATGSWQRIAGSGTITTDTTATASMRRSGGVGTSTFWIDGVQMELLSVSTPYIETAGAAASRSAARVRIDTAVFDEKQVAIAFRVAYGFPSTALPGSNAYLFDWRDDASNLLGLYFDVATKKWTVSRLAAAAGGSAVSAVQAFAADDETTVILACTATQVKVSVAGAPFVAASNSSIPSLAAALADLSSQAGSAGWLNGRIKWVAACIGGLTDADAARIAAYASIPDPAPFAIMPGLTALVPFLDATYTAFPGSTDVALADSAPYDALVGDLPPYDALVADRPVYDCLVSDSI